MMDTLQPSLCQQSGDAQGNKHLKMVDHDTLQQQYRDGHHEHRCGNWIKTFFKNIDLTGEQKKKEKINAGLE